MHLSGKPVLRLCLLAVLLVGLVLIGRRAGVTGYLSLPQLRASVAAAGSLGMPLFFVAFAAGTLLQIPGLVFVAAGVLIYGRLYGGILSGLAALFALALSFLLTRLVGGRALHEIDRPLLRKLLSRLDRRPIFTVIVLRLVFILSPQLNTVLALSALRFRDYLIGSAIGLLPSMLAAVLLFDRVLSYLGQGP